MATAAQPVDIGILLALAYQEFVRQLRQAHAADGFEDLGRSDGYVLRALAVRPMTTAELATRLQISKQGAGQIIDDMQKRGYVDRRADPTDARARLLHLSDRGLAALAAARRFHAAFERRMVRAHGREAVTTLRAVLESVAGGAGHTIDPHLRALFL